MIFGGRFRDGSNEPQKNDDIIKIKTSIENEDKIFSEELPLKYSLLAEFTVVELRRLCSRLLGRQLPMQRYTSPVNGSEESLPNVKEDYIHFLVDEMGLSEMIEFARQNGIGIGHNPPRNGSMQ